MKYTMENFKNGEFVVNCKNRSESILFMGMFEYGEAIDDMKYDSHWNRFGERTCYTYNDNFGVAFSNIDYFISKGCDIIDYSELINERKSNKEKILEMIEVKVGEKFNILNCGYNPYSFDKNGNLRDSDCDHNNPLIGSILLGDLIIEKIPEDPNKDIKECIHSLSNDILIDLEMRNRILLFLNELLALKEAK